MNRGDRRLVLRALVVVAAIRLGLWLLPLDKLQRNIARSLQRLGVRPRRSRVDSALAIAHSVEIAARSIRAATCLTQALAAQLLLFLAGHVSSLRIGMHKAGGKFKAHAWLVWEGQIIIGDTPGIDDFKMLPLR